jgi:hypothetical protein
VVEIDHGSDGIGAPQVERDVGKVLGRGRGHCGLPPESDPNKNLGRAQTWVEVGGQPPEGVWLSGICEGARPHQQACISKPCWGFHRIHEGCKGLSHPRSYSTTGVHDTATSARPTEDFTIKYIYTEDIIFDTDHHARVAIMGDIHRQSNSITARVYDTTREWR